MRMQQSRRNNRRFSKRTGSNGGACGVKAQHSKVGDMQAIIDASAEALLNGAPNRPAEPFDANDFAMEKATWPAHCFYFETLIVAQRVADDGTVGLCGAPINLLDPGDLVLSRSEATGEVDFRKVLRVMSRTISSSELFNVVTWGESGSRRGFEATGEHPVWINGHGWVEVKDLRIGHQVLQHDGELLTIKHIARDENDHDPVEVYNLEIEEFNTYYADAVWVHNCNGRVLTQGGEIPLRKPSDVPPLP
jgi:hypothetical protein